MAEDKAVKNTVKSAPEATKAEPQKLAKTEKLKAIVAEAPSAVKAQSEVKPQAPEIEAKEAAEPAKPGLPKAEAEAPKAEAKAKKEADPNKEFVDGIMAEMNLKGASKKRLIRKLAEQHNFDKQKVMLKLRRALITERYAAASGH